MFQKKIVVILISAFISVSLISSYFLWMDDAGLSFFTMSLVIGSFVVPVIALYGLPVTLLAERWTGSLSPIKQSIFSLFIHVLFGVAFVFIIGLFLEPRLLFTNFNHFWSDAELFLLSAVGISICVWAVDQAIKCYVLLKGKGYGAS